MSGAEETPYIPDAIPLCRKKLHPQTPENLYPMKRQGETIYTCRPCREVSEQRWNEVRKQARRNDEAIEAAAAKYVAELPLNQMPYDPATEEEQERFLSKIDERDGCWIWTARTGGSPTNPTPVASWRGANVTGRYVAWYIFRGRVEAPFWFSVTCGNSLCVNPDHLDYTNTAPPRGGRPGGVPRSLPVTFAKTKMGKRKAMQRKKGRVKPARARTPDQVSDRTKVKNCPNGHEYEEVGYTLRSNGWRWCNACRAEQRAVSEAKAKAKRQAAQENWAESARAYFESLGISHGTPGVVPRTERGEG